MSKRIVWIDIAKGLLIFLVILGHCEVYDGIKYFIYSFHMGAFFFLSGLTFSTKSSPKNFLIKKIKSLILPYLLFSLVLTIYNYIKHIVFDYAFNLKDAIMSFIFPISGKYESSVYGLWFLPCIFLTELLLYCIIKLYNKSRFISIVSGFVTIMGLVVLYVFTKIACVVTIIPIAMLCILCGYLSKKIFLNYDNKRTVILVGVSLILFILCVLFNQLISDSSLDMSSLNLGCAPFYILSTLFGSVLICSISIFIAKVKFTKTIIFIGTYSLYFYGFHYEVLGIISNFIKNPFISAVLTLMVLLPIVFTYTNIKSKIEGKINDKCNSTSI